MNRLSYRPDIDGLRAVAVLGVLFFHAGLGCQGGFVGVDVFFVISGFLITSLILRDLREGTFSFVDFWARRIRRIVPALAVMTIAVIVVGYFGMFPDYYEELGKQVIALVLCVSNVKFWRETGGYFDTASDEKPLLHTWSLSVEEQFYFIIPIALFLVFRFKREKLALPLIILTCVMSFAASVYASVNHPSANFYLLPTRAWELGVGSLLAFAGPIKNPKLREFSSFVGLTLIIGCYFLFPEGVSFPGASALPPVLGAALLIWSGIGQDHLPAINRFLTLEPVVGIGLISYSLYLWHWPIFAYQKHLGYSADSDAVQFSLLAISFLPAWLSWKFVETPFRKKILLQKQRHAVQFGLSCVISFLLLGFMVVLFNGVPSRFSAEQARVIQLKEGHLRYVNNGQIGRYLCGDPDGEHLVYVWGDSHAMAILPALESPPSIFNGVIYSSTRSSTLPIFNFERIRAGENYEWDKGQKPFNNAVFQDIEEKSQNYSHTTVIITGMFPAYEKIDGFSQAFIKSAETLKLIGVNNLVVMLDVPHFKDFNPNFYYKPINFLFPVHKQDDLERDLPSVTLQNYLEKRKKLDECLSQLSPNFVRQVDPIKIMLNGDKRFLPVIFEDDGKITPTYRDTHHLNLRGAELFRESLFNAIMQNNA